MRVKSTSSHINMSPLLFVSTLLLVASCRFAVNAQSPCDTPSGKTGRCVSVHECSSLSKLTTSEATPDERKLLLASFCGFDDATPLVCCPSNTCSTPDGFNGICIGLFSCTHLVDMLRSRPTPTQAAVDYVQRSKCKGPDPYSVCCGPSPQPTPNTGEKINPRYAGECQLTAFPPDPSSNCCGLESNIINKIFGGEETAIGEYPWSAIIEYGMDNRIKLSCGGVLISGQYVITAAHCVVGSVLRALGTPVNVRLGEYDTSHSGPDCVEADGGGQDCNHGADIVPIERTIPHPDYSRSSIINDIALIRLARIVKFTDFIRPICLPTADFTTSPPANALLYVAGWGAVDNYTRSSNIKLKVVLPYVPYQECQPSYSFPRRQVQLWEGQLCAGGVRGKDSCKGDSGGPLMTWNGTYSELVGVVSFGPTPCGTENVPGVYTKVFHYLPWITSQIVT